MNRYSMENCIGGMPNQLFHNYDVLLLSSTDGEAPRFAQGSHVGNQRFRVLLSLFREGYLKADLFGHENECTSIAQEVLDTVTSKCLPNGRIFVQGHDNRWQQLDLHSTSTITLVQNALKYDPVEDVIERSPEPFCRIPSRFDMLYQIASKGFGDKPLNAFDVVCEANGLGISIDCQHTGNNRLMVMIALRLKSYRASSQEDKHNIAEDIVKSITDDASGQFLKQDLYGQYKVVTKTSAITCVLNALEGVSSAEKRKMRASEVSNLVQRKHKKALLDRLEKRKGVDNLLSRSTGAPPTRFNAFRRHNEFVSKAA